jgi:hypothetical protein
LGFRVNREVSHLAVKHLDPICNLVPPSDIHELCRVLGLFVVSRKYKYLRDYALASKPMTDILKGKPHIQVGVRNNKRHSTRSKKSSSPAFIWQRLISTPLFI